jgi:sulfur carrier protein ThiS
MVKKLFVPVILALVAALALSQAAFASSKTNTRVLHINGSISSVDLTTSTIRVETSAGKRTVHLDENTTYRGIASSLADLTPWMVVKVAAKLLPNGDFLGVTVNAIKIEVVSTVYGQVTTLTPKTFTILGTDGSVYTFQVKAKTSFSGFAVKRLSQVHPGMRVKVAYTDMSNGNRRALNVTILGLK